VFELSPYKACFIELSSQLISRVQSLKYLQNPFGLLSKKLQPFAFSVEKYVLISEYSGRVGLVGSNQLIKNLI
jgi:hypothetical protein